MSGLRSARADKLVWAVAVTVRRVRYLPSASLAAAILLTACTATSQAGSEPSTPTTDPVTTVPAPPPGAPSVDVLTVPVPAMCEQPPGTLVDGSLPNPVNNGFVSVLTELTTTGDLVGDATPETVAAIACSAGGIGWPHTIHIYAPGLVQLVQINLGDHNPDGIVALVESVEIVDRVLVVRWVTDAPGDPTCCPTIRLEGRFTLSVTATGDITVLEGSLPGASTTVAASVSTALASDACAAEISADLGTEIEVIDGLCIEGWAYIDSCPGCGGDTQQVVRFVDDVWTVAVPLPIPPDLPQCRADWEAQGMPTAILDRIGWPCPTATEGANGVQAAVDRFQQWVRAMGTGDAAIYCEIGAPGYEAQGMPQDACLGLFDSIRSDSSAEELASISEASVDPNLVVQATPDRVEIPGAAVSFPVPISDWAAPDEVFVMGYDGTNWFIVEYPPE